MSLRKFSFKVTSKENYARTGLIKTHRGKIHTPVFMPVGTQATVKATFIDDIIETGSEIILANTYHLMLRPGLDRIKKCKGLHKYMNCKLPILQMLINLGEHMQLEEERLQSQEYGLNMEKIR